MRHRKTALKSYLTTLRAMQLQRTRTIDVVKNASETSSDRLHRVGDAAPLVLSLRPLIACRQSLLPGSLIDVARIQAPTLAAWIKASLAEGHLAVRLRERACPDALHEGI